MAAPQRAPFNARLRGSDPIVHVDASNLSVRLDSTCINAASAAGMLTLVQSSVNAPLLHITTTPNNAGVALCATSAAAPAGRQLHLRPAVDVDALTVGSNGRVTIGTVSVGAFCNLAVSHTQGGGATPASATALSNAYTALSNQVVAVREAPPRLATDVWLRSHGDSQPRAYFAGGAATRWGAGRGIPGASNAFVLSLTDAAAVDPVPPVDLVRIKASGDVWFGGALRMGDHVTVTHSSSNVGLNMPEGAQPLCTLHVNGQVQAEEVFSISDAREKTRIEPLDGALDRLARISPCTFVWVRDDERDPLGAKRNVGVLAQDVQAVLPEAVREVAADRLGVAYPKLVALAIAGINDLAKRVQAIEQRMQAIEQRM